MARPLGATAVLLTLSIGCGESRPDRLILEYPGFAFEQTFESTFDWFVVNKAYEAFEMPLLQVDFGDGSLVALPELTEDWIDSFGKAHPDEHITLEELGGQGVPLYENIKVRYYKARSFHVRFDNGKPYSLRLMGKGTVTNPKNGKAVVLPATEEQIRAVFGEPEKVHKLKPLS